MTDEHDELREMRSDLLGYMRERFDGMDRRLDVLAACATDHESRISVLEAVSGGGESTPMMRNPKTYAVGGVGMAIGTIALEILKVFGLSK
jgi:hypothetical protein